MSYEPALFLHNTIQYIAASFYTILGYSLFFSGIISGVAVYQANVAIGAIWLILGGLWFLFVPLAAVMIFMVSMLAARAAYGCICC